MGSAALTEAAKSIRDWSLSDRTSSTPAVRAADVFGSLVFNDKVQQERLPKPAYRALRATITRGEPLDICDRRRRGHGAEGLGGRARRHALHALVPAADRHHGREARLVSLAVGRRLGHRRVPRQGTDPGRARCVELPVGRHAHHLRGARLHGVGPDQPAVAALQRQQRHARHPDRVRQLDRRGARQEDAAAAVDGRRVQAGGARPEAVRVDRRARVRHLRPRAGILPDRPELLLRAARPDQRRAHAVRRQAAEGPGAGGPVLRLDSRARAGAAWRKRSSSCSRSACRSRRGTTKWPPASTRSRRSSRTPTSPSIIS